MDERPTMDELTTTALLLSEKGKGLLASDESTGTIGKRLEKHGVENTEANRREYRELFYGADIGSSYSGAIMFEETLKQSAADGTKFVDLLKSKGVMAGIKVDEGLVPVGNPPRGETITRGLATLDERCAEYYEAGARFAKWRAAFKVADDLPTESTVQANATQLAKYAAICQSNNLVPIVEPEILIDGSHGQQEFADTSERVIQSTVAALWREGVFLEGCLLKPQMIMAGADCTSPKPTAHSVARHTLRVMKRSVPPAIPGILFLSGGQSEEEATLNLNAINQCARDDGGAPWSLSFSFGRGLQASVLKLWSEDRSKKQEAQEMAAALARANAAASMGQFKGPHPSITSAQGMLREDFRGWRTDVGQRAS